MNVLTIKFQTEGWGIERRERDRWQCTTKADDSEFPSKTLDEESLSPESIRYFFEKGQMACNVETLWRELIQKWTSHGIHLQSPDAIRLQDVRCVYPSAPDIAELTAEADAELETIFSGLVNNWKEATGGYSFTYRRYAHPSYQAILTLGKKDVVPLILRELQQRPDWWFEALTALTKQNPVKPAATFEEAVDAWIAWGKQNRLIS